MYSHSVLQPDLGPTEAEMVQETKGCFRGDSHAAHNWPLAGAPPASPQVSSWGQACPLEASPGPWPFTPSCGQLTASFGSEEFYVEGVSCCT